MKTIDRHNRSLLLASTRSGYCTDFWSECAISCGACTYCGKVIVSERVLCTQLGESYCYRTHNMSVYVTVRKFHATQQGFAGRTSTCIVPASVSVVHSASSRLVGVLECARPVPMVQYQTMSPLYSRQVAPHFEYCVPVLGLFTIVSFSVYSARNKSCPFGPSFFTLRCRNAKMCLSSFSQTPTPQSWRQFSIFSPAEMFFRSKAKSPSPALLSGGFAVSTSGRSRKVLDKRHQGEERPGVVRLFVSDKHSVSLLV